MRRLCVTLLAVFALLANGFIASAMAASACPLQMELPAVTAPHDCCPEAGPINSGQPAQHSAVHCPLGMACQANVLMAPFPSRAPLPKLTALIEPAVDSAGVATGLLQEHFRPPRNF